MPLPHRGQREAILPYLLLSPGLLLLLGMLYPFFLGVYYSLTNYYLQYPHLFRFIWLGNYIKLLEDPLFAYSLKFTLAYAIVAVVVQVGLGLAVALLLNSRIKGRGVLRAMMLMPLMMPPVITALMWKVMMASTKAGILNYLLSFAGLGPVNWLGAMNSAIVFRLYHRHLGKPALRLPDPAGRAAVAAHRAVRGGPGGWSLRVGGLPVHHAAPP